jgi:4'-phosphopantetheinyl transferase
MARTGVAGQLLERTTVPDEACIEKVLSPDPDIEVWTAKLEAGTAGLAEHASMLSADERARAGRFHFERDRHRFIVARGILRTLVAQRMGLMPARVAFTYRAYGKPAVAADSTLDFNLSHSGNRALFAFCRKGRVGVDLEALDGDVDVMALAKRYFHPRETMALLQLPQGLRRPAFFACWTRKEAVVKATGEGLLATPLDAFEVSVAPDAPPRILAAARLVPGAWSLHTIDALPGYAATIAVWRKTVVDLPT